MTQCAICRTAIPHQIDQRCTALCSPKCRSEHFRRLGVREAVVLGIEKGTK